LNFNFSIVIGCRPYGLNLILVGIESSPAASECDIKEHISRVSPKIFFTDASGNVVQCRAAAIGRNSDLALRDLEVRYTADMDDDTVATLLREVMESRRHGPQGGDGAVGDNSVIASSTFEIFTIFSGGLKQLYGGGPEM